MADDPQDLLRLADSVEKATRPDRGLDGMIQRAMGPDFPTHYSGVGICKAFTASLDAAMTLVPEGWRLELEQHSSSWTATFLDKPWFADGITSEDANAVTPALAIAAAALKARAHSTKDTSNHVE